MASAGSKRSYEPGAGEFMAEATDQWKAGRTAMLKSAQQQLARVRNTLAMTQRLMADPSLPLSTRQSQTPVVFSLMDQERKLQSEIDAYMRELGLKASRARMIALGALATVAVFATGAGLAAYLLSGSSASATASAALPAAAAAAANVTANAIALAGAGAGAANTTAVAANATALLANVTANATALAGAGATNTTLVASNATALLANVTANATALAGAGAGATLAANVTANATATAIATGAGLAANTTVVANVTANATVAAVAGAGAAGAALTTPAVLAAVTAAATELGVNATEILAETSWVEMSLSTIGGILKNTFYANAPVMVVKTIDFILESYDKLGELIEQLKMFYEGNGTMTQLLRFTATLGHRISPENELVRGLVAAATGEPAYTVGGEGVAFFVDWLTTKKLFYALHRLFERYGDSPLKYVFAGVAGATAFVFAEKVLRKLVGLHGSSPVCEFGKSCFFLTARGAALMAKYGASGVLVGFRATRSALRRRRQGESAGAIEIARPANADNEDSDFAYAPPPAAVLSSARELNDATVVVRAPGNPAQSSAIVAALGEDERGRKLTVVELKGNVVDFGGKIRAVVVLVVVKKKAGGEYLFANPVIAPQMITDESVVVALAEDDADSAISIGGASAAGLKGKIFQAPFVLRVKGRDIDTALPHNRAVLSALRNRLAR